MSENSSSYPDDPISSKRRRPKKQKLESLAGQVYQHLRTEIIHGQLQPGDKLVELDIAAEMGTSQGPAREALQRLERDGLVERRAWSSTVVTSFSLDEIHEFFSIRRVVEGFAIRRVLRNIQPEQLHELEELVEKMCAAGQKDELFELVEYDMQFHQRICEWSNSAVLLGIWIPLYSQIQRFIAQNHKRFFPNLVELAETHQPIVDALHRGDPDEAAQAVQDHIMIIWSHLEPTEEIKREPRN